MGFETYEWRAMWFWVILLETRRNYSVTTEFMLKTQNIEALQFRGRWASAATMQHYVQVSLRSATMAALHLAVRSRIQCLADLAPMSMNNHQAMCLVLQSVPARLHDVILVICQRSAKRWGRETIAV
eukprot:1753555-Amphidinium_carterae.1